METVRLPRVAVSRELATALIKKIAPQAGTGVTLDGRGLVVNNESFAFQLVEDLAEQNVSSVILLGGSSKWDAAVKTAAEAFHLSVERQALPA